MGRTHQIGKSQKNFVQILINGQNARNKLITRAFGSGIDEIIPGKALIEEVGGGGDAREGRKNEKGQEGDGGEGEGNGKNGIEIFRYDNISSVDIELK